MSNNVGNKIDPSIRVHVEAAKQIQLDVFAQDYYPDIYLDVLRKSKMTMKGIEQGEYRDKKLIDFMNDFWFALPNNSAIRRAPFWEICTIAEHIFDNDDE